MKKEKKEKTVRNPELDREKEEKDIEDGKKNGNLIDHGVAPIAPSTWLKF